MKRLLCLLVLLLIVGSVGAPFYASAKPTDSMSISALGEATLSKWGGASSLKVKPTDSVSMIGGKLKTSANIEIRVDQRSDGFEYSWILAEKPASNVFSLTLDFTGCNFYYQPPLDQNTYPKGWTANATHVFDDKGILREYRPIDVVGSYAVYGNQRNGIYQTGKVAHIYRPLVTDAAGKRTWGVMNISGDTLTVTVDQSWLDKATYPVVVDPTFGSTNAGASVLSEAGNQLFGTQVTSPAAANIRVSKFTAYVKLNAAGSCQFKAGVWVNSDGGAVVGVTSAGFTDSEIYSWRDASYTTPLAISSSTVYMIAILPALSAPAIIMAYDSGTGGTGHKDLSNLFATPGVFDWNVNNDYVMSLYATYTSAPSITSSVIAMDDTDNVYTMKAYYTFTTVINDPDGATDIKAISVRGTQGATVRWMVNATTLDGAPAYAIGSGSTVIDLDAAGCSFTENVNDGTLVLSIRFEWDATNEADCELAVWAQDVIGNTVGWTTVQTDYFDVVSRLVTRDFTGNVTGATINSPVEISGYVRYALGPTYVNASTSYPPDAQFTAVKIYDDESTLQGTDATIVNGFFNLTITTPSSLGTILYYAYLDLVPDYTDDYAVDADYVAISISPAFGVVSAIPQGFTFFGANITQVYLTITAFTVWFTDSATALIGMVAGVLTLIVYISGEIINWTARMANFFVDLITFISSIFDGTVGGHNVWTEFNISAWIDFIPLVAFIIWFGGIPARAKRSGTSDVELLLRDLQVASWIIGEVWNWSFTVFNFVANMIMSFVGVFLP